MFNNPMFDNEEDQNDLIEIMPESFAEGGIVEAEQQPTLMQEQQPPQDNNPYPVLAEMIRQQGEGEDVILAHINPKEAEMLGVLADGGTVNPVTGLPQFGIGNFGKWFKSIAGGAGGAILGNMLLPGIGGVIGGAFGNAAGSVLRGRKDAGQAAIRGAAIGAMLPTAASLAGSGLTSVGAKGAGATLSNYGAKNAILPAIGLGGGGNTAAAANGLTAANNQAATSADQSVAQTSAPELGKQAAQQSFTDMLMNNSSSFDKIPPTT